MDVDNLLSWLYRETAYVATLLATTATTHAATHAHIFSPQGAKFRQKKFPDAFVHVRSSLMKHLIKTSKKKTRLLLKAGLCIVLQTVIILIYSRRPTTVLIQQHMQQLFQIIFVSIR